MDSVERSVTAGSHIPERRMSPSIVKTLQKLKSHERTPEAIKHLGDIVANSSDFDVVCRSIKVLKEIGGSEAKPALAGLLRGLRAKMRLNRKSSIDVLGTMKDAAVPAVPALNPTYAFAALHEPSRFQKLKKFQRGKRQFHICFLQTRSNAGWFYMSRTETYIGWINCPTELVSMGRVAWVVEYHPGTTLR